MILNARDDCDGLTAPTANLDIHVEHALESLGLGHSSMALLDQTPGTGVRERPLALEYATWPSARRSLFFASSAGLDEWRPQAAYSPSAAGLQFLIMTLPCSMLPLENSVKMQALDLGS